MKFPPTDLEVATQVTFHDSNQVKGEDGDSEEIRLTNGDKKSAGTSKRLFINDVIQTGNCSSRTISYPVIFRLIAVLNGI